MAKTKFLIIGLVIIMLFTFLSGCTNNKYNAKLYDNAIEWINVDFANNNQVGNLSFSNRTFIIDSQEKYDQVFNNNELEIDFNNQMLVVYTFITIYHRKNYIKNIDVKNSVLKITYEMEKKPGVGDASQPYQRWFVVKLDKLDVNSVVFEEKL